MSARHSLPLVLALFVGSSAVAQTRPIRVGFQASIALSKIAGDNQAESGMLAGPLVGGFASLELSQKLSVESGLNYVGKGSHYTTSDVDLKIGYVQIPILGKFQGGDPSQRIVPVVMGGPVLSLKSGCSIHSGSVKVSCDPQTTDVAGTDVGFLVGAGAAKGPFRAMLRYEYGLKNINADGPANVKNRSLSLALGYEFRLGGGGMTRQAPARPATRR